MFGDKLYLFSLFSGPTGYRPLTMWFTIPTKKFRTMHVVLIQVRVIDNDTNSGDRKLHDRVTLPSAA